MTRPSDLFRSYSQNKEHRLKTVMMNVDEMPEVVLTTIPSGAGTNRLACVS